MWKLKLIEAENLCAFRSLAYTPHQGVTTLIFGDNRDNDSQQSNGAGKSALLECIAVGITGSPLRKIRSEEIINDTAEECRIRLHFVNDADEEEMEIRRRIPRKGASSVACILYRGGKEVTTDEAVQPSVDAYNRYILEKLGITRDELLNNFILSKYRYEDFLSSSDKEKKEIINRFSNGILVDEAIARVEADMEPLSGEQRDAALELAGMDGRVEMLLEQIRKEEEAGAERGRTRENRIRELEASIASKRALMRDRTGTVAACERQVEEIRRADEALQELEGGDAPLEECLKGIGKFMPLFPGAGQTDWNGAVAAKKESLRAAEARLDDHDRVLCSLEKELEEKRKAWELFKAGFAAFHEDYREKSAATAGALQEMDNRLRDLASRIEELRHKRRVVSAGIDELSNKLAGSIKCPSCGHEFLVAHPGFDIAEGMKELGLRQRQLGEINAGIDTRQKENEEMERRQARLNNDRRTLDSERDRMERKLAEHERDVRNTSLRVENAGHDRERIAAGIATLRNDIEGIRRKVFDEVFGFVDDRHAAIDREIRAAKEEIRAAECAIETLQATIREVNESSGNDMVLSLKAALREARVKANAAAERKLGIDARIRALEIQKERFVQFKTYLANTKIEALGRVTNEFLAGIGSDIRIRFDGYTVLKSGKVREKISISLLRDGMDCGSFGKFSAGEAARVNLATILAMQKLVNANCEEGKGLDLLVLDEILEAVDETGLASMFEALNALGGTVMVVSHGNVAEGYPHRLVVTKENGESRIDR